MKRAVIALAVCASVYAVSGFVPTYVESGFSRTVHAQAAAGDLQVLHIRGHLYMLSGDGGNITASVGKDGVLLVDSGLPTMTDKVLAALARIGAEVDQRDYALESIQPKFGAETRSTVMADRDTRPPIKPIRYIVNTHAHPDHVGGNEKLATSGRTFTGGNVAGDIRDAAMGAAILAHENVLVRMSAATPPPPTDALPTDTYYVDSMKLSHFFNGEGIVLQHRPAAHTDGDTMVFFRGTDVIAAGDLYSTTTYPIIDVERGGHINGVLDGLNQILDLSVAEFRTEGGTLVVPGHGRLSDSADVAYYRDMVTIIRDRVADMVKNGKTLEQVKAAKVTADYDGRYGATTGFWTTDMFLEAVYRNLSAASVGSRPAAPRTTRGR